jgi:hypothetical protein
MPVRAKRRTSLLDYAEASPVSQLLIMRQ